MKKTRVYSVRLQSLTAISDKCYRAVAFDGSSGLIPKSQVFGQDYDVIKSDAYWISAWILEQKNIQYSTKKEGWYNPSTQKVEQYSHLIIETHIPEKIEPIISTADDRLTRQPKKKD